MGFLSSNQIRSIFDERLQWFLAECKGRDQARIQDINWASFFCL